MLEDIEDKNAAIKSCSIVDKIERFEREFVFLMNKSLSFSNVNIQSGHMHHTGGMNKYYSLVKLLETENSIESYNLGRELNSSTVSVSSELGSGLYSRDSSLDLSFMSSIADGSDSLISASLISEPLVMYFEPLVMQSTQ